MRNTKLKFKMWNILFINVNKNTSKVKFITILLRKKIFDKSNNTEKLYISSIILIIDVHAYFFLLWNNFLY